MAPHLHGQDLPGSHVVAEAEPAGDAENLEAVQHRGRFQQPVDVEYLGRGPGRLEGEGRFLVAIGSGSAEDEDVGMGHGEPETLASGIVGELQIENCKLKIANYHRSGFCQCSFRTAMSQSISTVLSNRTISRSPDTVPICCVQTRSLGRRR